MPSDVNNRDELLWLNVSNVQTCWNDLLITWFLLILFTQHMSAHGFFSWTRWTRDVMDRWQWCRVQGQVMTSVIRALEVTRLAHRWPLTDTLQSTRTFWERKNRLFTFIGVIDLWLSMTFWNTLASFINVMKWMWHKERPDKDHRREELYCTVLGKAELRSFPSFWKNFMCMSKSLKEHFDFLVNCWDLLNVILHIHISSYFYLGEAFEILKRSCVWFVMTTYRWCIAWEIELSSVFL